MKKINLIDALFGVIGGVVMAISICAYMMHIDKSSSEAHEYATAEAEKEAEMFGYDDAQKLEAYRRNFNIAIGD